MINIYKCLQRITIDIQNLQSTQIYKTQTDVSNTHYIFLLTTFRSVLHLYQLCLSCFLALGRLLRVDLITCVKCPSAREYVHKNNMEERRWIQTSDNDFVSVLQKPASNSAAKLNSFRSSPAQLQQTSVWITCLNHITSR